MLTLDTQYNSMGDIPTTSPLNVDYQMECIKVNLKHASAETPTTCHIGYMRDDGIPEEFIKLLEEAAESNEHIQLIYD